MKPQNATKGTVTDLDVNYTLFISLSLDVDALSSENSLVGNQHDVLRRTWAME